MDVTTGDIITPREIDYTFKLLFDDRTLSVLAYNLEMVLAEKIETVLSRSIANARPRDFYDIHIIYVLRGTECDKDILRQALERTTEKRGSGQVMQNFMDIIKEIKASHQMQNLWKKYQNNFDYARDISFDEVCNTIQSIMSEVMV